MNRLILLFIPFISFGQTYKEVMSISSVDMFKKVAIENGYEYDGTDEDGFITYGWGIVKDSIEGNRAQKWMMYNAKDDRFTFNFSRSDVVSAFFGTVPDNSGNPYDLIVKGIKEKCKYYKILNYNDGIDYVTYSCSESSYKGKIGFMTSEGFGYIRHFIPE